MTDGIDPLLARAAQLDTFALGKLADGTVIIENPLGLTQLAFTRDQWKQAVEFVDADTPEILEEP